jgi:hypothetical protein
LAGFGAIKRQAIVTGQFRQQFPNRTIGKVLVTGPRISNIIDGEPRTVVLYRALTTEIANSLGNFGDIRNVRTSRTYDAENYFRSSYGKECTAPLALDQ